MLYVTKLYICDFIQDVIATRRQNLYFKRYAAALKCSKVILKEMDEY